MNRKKDNILKQLAFWGGTKWRLCGMLKDFGKCICLPNTIFIEFQADSNLKMTPPQKMECLRKEKYFTINFVHLIHGACQILSTFTAQFHCLHLHSQCLPHSNSEHSHPFHCHSTTYHHQSHPLHWIYSDTSANEDNSFRNHISLAET